MAILGEGRGASVEHPTLALPHRHVIHKYSKGRRIYDRLSGGSAPRVPPEKPKNLENPSDPRAAAPCVCQADAVEQLRGRLPSEDVVLLGATCVRVW